MCALDTKTASARQPWRRAPRSAPPGASFDNLLNREVRLAAIDLTLEVAGRILLTGLTLDVAAGETVAIVGPSGSGKTTLLRSLAGLHAPQAGDIRVGGVSIWNEPESTRTQLRLQKIGFVFQTGDLLADLPVLENVSVPLRLQNVRREDAQRRSLEILDALGLRHVATKWPDEISGGERQRVALARAIVHKPLLVLADEPTGSLDAQNAASVSDTVVRLCKTTGAAAVVATHDPEVATRMDWIVDLRSVGSSD